MNCNRCNRKLRDQKSINRGYGPVCYKKHIKEARDAEFDRKQITIDELEEKNVSGIKLRAYARNADVMVYQKDFNKWYDGFMMLVEFKPWDDEETQFNAEYISLENDDEEHTMYNPPLYSSDDMVEVMQYAGLKDKNGTEIYEGDIYHEGDPDITYTVVWHDTGLIGKQTGSSSYCGLEHWQDRIEVLGNIYDNPELVGDSNV